MSTTITDNRASGITGGALAPTQPRLQNRRRWKLLAYALVTGLALFLALYQLDRYPLTWFDEGSHLHVPKTLVRFGVYADYSSEGFRYYGPTVGVGPTVMLPIAGAFQAFGVGLLQARFVMALYLLGSIVAYYCLARRLGGRPIAWVAVAVLATSPGIAFVEYGRQVLGEVPGLFFLLVGLLVWFSAWSEAKVTRLALAGLCLGLAAVTKNQYLLILVPAIGVAWLTNWLFYKDAPHRLFIVPGLVVVLCYLFWQLYIVVALGPATVAENLVLLQKATAGAALVFSPQLMARGARELLGIPVFFGSLVPVLIYGAALATPRHRESQQWGILLAIVAVNLVWYVVASISWLRYAFPGLAIASLFVARFFHDMTQGYHLEWRVLAAGLRQGGAALREQAARLALLAWLVLMVGLPLVRLVADIAAPPLNTPAAMASYLNEYVPQDAVVETWEPEMGFLTDHNYHFPPPGLLNDAVSYIWLGGPPPSQQYDFVQRELPDYVLVGAFSRWVDLYPRDFLQTRYELVVRIGAYELFALAN